jgi:hypothetical protein
VNEDRDRPFGAVHAGELHERLIGIEQLEPPLPVVEVIVDATVERVASEELCGFAQ